MERLWQPATVLDTSGGRVRLRFDRLSQCHRCLRGEGCGAGVFSQLFSRRSMEFDLASDRVWQAGQRVRVGIISSGLARGSIALYGWPLLGFLAGAVIGDAVGPIYWQADVSALFGGVLLGTLTTLLSWRKRHDRLNPVIEALSCDAYPDRA